MRPIDTDVAISVRGRQDLKIAAAGEAFASLFHGAPDSLLILDRSRSAAANEAAVAKFGYPLDEFIDGTVVDLVVPECQDPVCSRTLQPYGHPSGDRVLALLARALRHASRTGDLPARIGGDEFMLLLPRTTKPNAIRVAEKLRQRIEQIPFVDDIQVSVSIGVASVPDDGETEGALPAAVDQAMYRAKQPGGRGVAFSS